ncbi:MAG: multicopper oxidase domain-containing protein [Nitrospinaceae bacterium]|jgi:blue copper oxidase|nr:multicopper oxidase domain-containing protein [Nitrospinaceae bacterium]
MPTRRSVLKTILVGGTAIMTGQALPIFGREASAASKFSNMLKIPPLLHGEKQGMERVYDLRLQRGNARFFKGYLTPTLGVNGNFLGPTVKMRTGEDVRLNVTNTIGESTTLHWHGFHVPAKYDGGPHQVISDRKTWSPHFKVMQMAATYWYHPHMMHKTGEHVWRGLAGFIIVEDNISDKLNLPRDYGVNDIPLVLQDRRFNREGSFSYVSSMHDVMMGMKGDTMLVNGTIAPYFEAKTQKLRLRLLNGSNARFYNIGFDDERLFHQIATDGSFLETPFETNRIQIGPGERAEIIVDVSDNKHVVLRSYPVVSSGMGMGRRMGSDMRGFDCLEIRPTAKLRPSPKIPANLIVLPKLKETEAAITRRFKLEMRMGPGMMFGGSSPFRINGKSMKLSRIDEVVKLGDTEIWEIENNSPMPHPFHIHDIQFLILDRNGRPPSPGERGFKDTVTVNQAETVRIIAKFADYADPEKPYMYHCHILEHEDAGMMGQFIVKA